MSKDMPKKRVQRWLWLGLVILIVAAVVYKQHSSTQAPKKGTMPQQVGVVQVSVGSMPETLTALGTVAPTATVVILPQLSGYITDVGFTEGQEVTKGQFLAQIDPRPYQVQLELYQAQQAKDVAALQQGKSDLHRYEILQGKKSISEQQVTDQKFLVMQQEAAVRIDQANIDSAKLNLKYCHISAPTSGKVGLRLVDPGNYITSASSTGIVVITTIKPITVIFSIPQRELAVVLARMQAGAVLTTTAYSNDYKRKIAKGTLTAIDNQVDASTGTVKLRASFDNADEALFPNEFVNIRLLVNTMQDATLVPSPAVQTGTLGSYVFLVQPNHTVTIRKVSVGPTDGTHIVITNGLKPGDTVVTDGVDRLREGMEVAMGGTPAIPHDSADQESKKHPE